MNVARWKQQGELGRRVLHGWTQPKAADVPGHPVSHCLWQRIFFPGRHGKGMVPVDKVGWHGITEPAHLIPVPSRA